MKPKRDTKQETDQLVSNIKRATRRTFSAEEKIRIVLAELRGEDRIADLCRREGLHQNLYLGVLRDWKKRLTENTERKASREDVSEMRKESAQLKEGFAAIMLEYQLLKKSVLGTGEDGI